MVDPVPGFKRIRLLGIDKHGKVHLLHSLFSFLVGLYSAARQIFACLEELPDKSLPMVVELPVEDFPVQRSVNAVLREDHVSHLEGVISLVWQSMPCKRAVKLSYIGSNLLCQWPTFVPLDVAASLFLGTSLNIVEVVQTLSPLLSDWSPLFEEALNLLQCTYTTDRRGSYVLSASTILVQSMVLEGYYLFSLIYSNLCWRYPGYYDPPLPSTSTTPPPVLITLIITQFIGRLSTGILT